MTTTARAYDYVNQPYERVRDAVRSDALAIFQRATKLAEDRSEAVVAALRVNLAGIELSKDIAIEIASIEEEVSPGSSLGRVTHVRLEWQAAKSPGLFPAMKGDLRIYPLSHTETQVELVGEYSPPMGLLGNVIDAVAGHRIAEASVHGFIRAVVERLRTELAD
jgi:ribosome-associated toxin RatA of RatAB toxin-antitoxin module